MAVLPRTIKIKLEQEDGKEVELDNLYTRNFEIEKVPMTQSDRVKVGGDDSVVTLRVEFSNTPLKKMTFVQNLWLRIAGKIDKWLNISFLDRL